MWPFNDSSEVARLKAKVAELESALDASAGLAKRLVDAYADELTEAQEELADAREELVEAKSYFERVRADWCKFRSAHSGCQTWRQDKEQVIAEVQTLRAQLAMKKAGERQDALLKAE